MITPEAIERLARELAISECWDNSAFGWDAEKEEHIQHFMGVARKNAQYYADFLQQNSQTTAEEQLGE